MRLTIIPIDGAVYKDGVNYLELDLSFIPSYVHALQWNNENGWVERTDGAANDFITELPEWASQALQVWEEMDYQTKNPPAPTPEQLIFLCKATAKQLLQETDYSELPDVKVLLLNSAEFTTYRAQIRDLYLNPVTSPVWPTAPKAQWATS